jgi:hypothetical protein
MIRAISTAIVAVFLCLPAAAQECLSPSAMAMQAVQSVPNASIKEMLKGDEARAVVDAFNAIDPVSDFKADFIVVIQAPAVPVYLVIAYTGHCVVFTHTWNRGEYDALRKSGV